MARIIKNISGSLLEINDWGISLQTDEVRDIDYCYAPSSEFSSHIVNGHVVYVKDDFTTELSVAETQSIDNKDSLPSYQQESSIFGSNFTYAESLSVTTRDDEYWYTKLILPVSASTSGLYRIGWSYQWSANSTSRDFEAKVILQDNGGGNSVDLSDHTQEPKDSGGSFYSTGTNQKHTSSGMRYRTLSVGDYEILIRFRTEDDGIQASMWNATAEFWRVQ